MKIIVLTLIVQCTDFIVASKIFHARENTNVLVPNDANIHAKNNIDNLLYNVDTELSDNDFVKYQFINRILHRHKQHDDVIFKALISSNEGPPKINQIPTNLMQSTHPPPITSTTPTPNPSANEECLFGVSNQNIKWVDKSGKIQFKYIASSNEMKILKTFDYSYEFADKVYDFRLFLKDTYNMLLFKVSTESIIDKFDDKKRILKIVFAKQKLFCFIFQLARKFLI